MVMSAVGRPHGCTRNVPTRLLVGRGSPVPIAIFVLFKLLSVAEQELFKHMPAGLLAASEKEVRQGHEIRQPAFI